MFNHTNFDELQEDLNYLMEGDFAWGKKQYERLKNFIQQQEVLQLIWNIGFFLRCDNELYLDEIKSGNRPKHTYSLCTNPESNYPFQRIQIYSSDDIDWIINQSYLDLLKLDMSTLITYKSK